MFASAAIPIFGIDLDGKVIEWNPATANCLGLEPSEVNFFPSTAKIFSVVPGRKSDWMFLHSSPCSCTALCSVLPPPALSRLCLSLSLARALSLSPSLSLSVCLCVRARVCVSHIGVGAGAGGKIASDTSAAHAYYEKLKAAEEQRQKAADHLSNGGLIRRKEAPSRGGGGFRWPAKWQSFRAVSTVQPGELLSLSRSRSLSLSLSLSLCVCVCVLYCMDQVSCAWCCCS